MVQVQDGTLGSINWKLYPVPTPEFSFFATTPVCILLLQGLSNFCGWRNHLPRSTKLQEPLALLIKAKHSQGLPRNSLLFMDQIHKVIECTLGSGYENCEFWESTEIRVKPVRKRMNSKQHVLQLTLHTAMVGVQSRIFWDVANHKRKQPGLNTIQGRQCEGRQREEQGAREKLHAIKQSYNSCKRG